MVDDGRTADAERRAARRRRAAAATGPTPARLAAYERLLPALPREKLGKPPEDAPVRRFRGTIAYDGSVYAGWQRQKRHVAVQEVLEAGLEEAVGEEVSVAASGRTDAGVHAEGQVFAFSSRTSLPAEAIHHRLDHRLPTDVRILDVREVPLAFDPQRHAVGKLYRYRLFPSDCGSPSIERIAWRVPASLDVAAMAAAARTLVGRHDFRGYRTDPGPRRRGEDTERTVTRLDVAAAGEFVLVDIEGEGFLYNMVRNLAAALVQVGARRKPPDWPRRVLDARDRRMLPPPAPAAGLCLVRVDYGERGLPFAPDAGG